MLGVKYAFKVLKASRPNVAVPPGTVGAVLCSVVPNSSKANNTQQKRRILGNMV